MCCLYISVGILSGLGRTMSPFLLLLRNNLFTSKVGPLHDLTVCMVVWGWVCRCVCVCRPVPGGGARPPTPTPTSNYRVPPAHSFHKYKLRLLYFRMQKLTLYSIKFIKKKFWKSMPPDPSIGRQLTTPPPPLVCPWGLVCVYVGVCVRVWCNYIGDRCIRDVRS